MNKELLLLILFISLLSFEANSQEYIFSGDSLIERSGGHGGYIIYKDSVCFKKALPPWSSLLFPKPEKFECDVNTFKVLKNGYAKDNYHIYYNGIKINDVDIASFTILKVENYSIASKHLLAYYELECFAKDKTQVFYGENIIKDADPNSFELFSYLYGKDESQAFFKGKPIDESDANSFELVEGRFAKDKNHVYHMGRRLSDNPESFQIIDYDSRYAKDKDMAYYWWGIGKPSEIDTLEQIIADDFNLLSDFRATDGERVFWHGQELPNADPATFKVIDHNYSADKDLIYYKNKIICKADPSTFSIFETKNRYGYSKDNKSVFFQDSNIEYADPATFIPLGYQWGKDKKFIYFENIRRKDIDYKTFIVDSHFARDKNYIYDTFGKRIKENTDHEIE